MPELNTLALLLIALLNAYVVWTSSRTYKVAQKTEVNTNSMREQLVRATALASHAEGKEEGRHVTASHAGGLNPERSTQRGGNQENRERIA